MANIKNRLEVLFKWINTFNLPYKVSSSGDLEDGVILLQILKYLAPNYFIYPLSGASLLAQDIDKRFEHIMIGLGHFCTIEFGYRKQLASEFPSWLFIEGGRAEDWVTLLQLLLLTSSRSVRKKECIRRMRLMRKKDIEELVEVMREAILKYCLLSTKVGAGKDTSTFLPHKDSHPADEKSLSKPSEEITRREEKWTVKNTDFLLARHERLKRLLTMADNNTTEIKNFEGSTEAHREGWESEKRTASARESTSETTETFIISAQDKEEYIYKFEMLHSQAATLRYGFTASAAKFELLIHIRGQESTPKSPFEDLSEEMAELGEELSNKNHIIKQLEAKVNLALEEVLYWEKQFKELEKRSKSNKIQESKSWKTENENHSGNIVKTRNEINEDVSRLQLGAFKVEIDDAQIEMEKLDTQISSVGDKSRIVNSIDNLEADSDIVPTLQQHDVKAIRDHEAVELSKELSSYQKERESLKRKLDETRYNVKMLEDFVRYTREEAKLTTLQSTGQVSQELKTKIEVLKEELTATIAHKTNKKIMDAFNEQKRFLDLLSKNMNHTCPHTDKGEDLKKQHEELKDLLVTIEKSNDIGKAEVMLGQPQLATL